MTKLEQMEATITASMTAMSAERTRRHHARYTVESFSENNHLILDKREGYKSGSYPTKAAAESAIRGYEAIDIISKGRPLILAPLTVGG